MPTTWHPCNLLNGHPTHPYAVIILNQSVNSNALAAVLGSASLLICADGGANHLYRRDRDAEAAMNAKNGTMKQARTRLPDAIVGDLDSLASEVEEYYRSRGVKVIKDPDQYSTDFTKCLKYIRTWAQTRQSHDDTMDVIVLGGLGGRVDQGFSQIHHLFMAENESSLLKGRIYLMSEQSLSFVLSSSSSSSPTTPGGNDGINTNIIYLQPGYFAENVGILPILGRTLLTSRGLEWDVEKWPTEFGGQVSTSNHIRADKIEIEFEGPRPLFTLELEKRLTAAGD
ncbi:thiamine pyrophosphokinase [Cladophialophora chaetospira]|uniref:Thiamine pyrophosphokinase n=1 Tax=Cladophialophora chaetospira TaxID=386627 RepID=A0AA38WXT8_9EURO|nr:thiamine pyrophosphokinase [Cladophialophora chaetospira]